MSTEDDFDDEKECESGPNLLLQKHKRERDLCGFFRHLCCLICQAQKVYFRQEREREEDRYKNH